MNSIDPRRCAHSTVEDEVLPLRTASVSGSAVSRRHQIFQRRH
jgi:hypothetical protein